MSQEINVGSNIATLLDAQARILDEELAVASVHPDSGWRRPDDVEVAIFIQVAERKASGGTCQIGQQSAADIHEAASALIDEGTDGMGPTLRAR